MTKLLCKLFRFFLNLFEQTVEVVARTLKSVGTAVVDVLDSLWDATLGNGGLGIGNILKWGAIGVGAYFLIGALAAGDDDDEDSSKKRSSQDSLTEPPSSSSSNEPLVGVT